MIGTSPESIDLAEDREKFKQILNQIGLKQPENETAMEPEDAKAAAARIGYPVFFAHPLFWAVGECLLFMMRRNWKRWLKRLLRWLLETGLTGQIS